MKYVFKKEVQTDKKKTEFEQIHQNKYALTKSFKRNEKNSEKCNDLKTNSIGTANIKILIIS